MLNIELDGNHWNEQDPLDNLDFMWSQGIVHAKLQKYEGMNCRAAYDQVTEYYSDDANLSAIIKEVVHQAFTDNKVVRCD